MERNQVKPEHQWRLEDIYPNEDQLEQELAKLATLSKELSAKSGSLNSAKALAAVLDLYYEARHLAERAFSYTRMRRDENNADGKYQALSDRAMGAVMQLEEAAAFLGPELLALPEEEVIAWVKAEPSLAVYERHILETLRMRPHMLDEAGERLLAMAGEVLSGPRNIFTMLNNADMKFPTIKDENGEDVTITHGRYVMLLESQDRRVRKDAYDNLYATFRKQINTIAATYATSVKADVFSARARNYAKAIDEALDPNEVPVSVYDNLVATIRSNSGQMGRYLSLRKKMLDVPELHFYDLYVPIAKDFDLKLPYEEAIDVVRKGLAPLGEEYLAKMEKAFTDSWVDVCETTGKTSGAYSWGVYGTHPYVLLNYQPTMDNIFTIAHELGHAMHSYHSNEAQPYPTSDYVIFVAEVASTVNELLLLEYLTKNAKSDAERAALLNHKLETIRGTVYRQTMFADFEKQTHAMCENNEALTPDSLCALYGKLNAQYYPGAVVDENIALEWARIPHFYRPFYVYQYATGFSAATALSRAILDGKSGALESYLSFLSGGSSASPLELLRKAGVDMESPAPVQACMKEFADALTQLEVLLSNG